MKDKILLDREKRISNVKNFFNLYKEDSLIMIKANIPGLNKNLPFVSYLLKVFLNNLKTTFNFFYLEYFTGFDGPYYLCGVKGQDEKHKRNLVHLENNHPLGRFIDLDYFIYSEKSLSRYELNLPLRKCILCENDAIYCMRNNKHQTSEILKHIAEKTVMYFSEVVVDLVDYAILKELKIEDKFGLVSLSSSGSHPDMNHLTMLKAKDAILPYFKLMFLKGYSCSNLTTLLASVRKDGIEAEQNMFKATDGINSYKGIIFLLGLAALSFGYTIKTSTDFKMLFANIKIIAHDIYADFDLDYNTFGVKLFHEKGISGIRGVAKDGFKVVFDNLNKLSISSSDQELRNLLHYFIVHTDDTIFIKRSKTFSNYLQYKKIISQYNPANTEDLKSLNDFAKTFNLSFGGSADLLIVAIFFINLKECFI